MKDSFVAPLRTLRQSIPFNEFLYSIRNQNIFLSLRGSELTSQVRQFKINSELVVDMFRIPIPTNLNPLKPTICWWV